MIFHKFFALRNWYNRAHPEKKLPDDYDWLTDEVFMTKYKKLFFESLVEMCKKKNTNISNVVFTIDCKHVYIWRHKEQVTYKATRKDSHTKSKFYSYKIFGIVIDKMLPKIIERYGCTILKHSECEADDVVANCVLLLNKGTKYDDDKSISYNLEPIKKDTNIHTDNQRKIYIVATDTDYIQICNRNVILMNLRCDELNSKYLTTHNNNSTYLMSKILSGDISDNIQCCMIRKKFLEENEINKRLKEANVAVLVAEGFEDLMMTTCELRNADSEKGWYLIKALGTARDEVIFQIVEGPKIEIQTERAARGISEFWVPIRTQGLFTGAPVREGDNWITKSIRGVTVILFAYKNSIKVQVDWPLERAVERDAYLQIFEDYGASSRETGTTAIIEIPLFDIGRNDVDRWDEIRPRLVEVGTSAFEIISQPLE